MDRALILQNPHWDAKPYIGLLKRAQLIKLQKQFALPLIQVLLGVRRAGKSTLFKLLINELLTTVDPQSILYINLDDPFFSDVWKDAKSLYTVLETAEKITGKAFHYLFLDEVQNVNGWERWVKSVYDTQVFKKICVTGSNSSLLRGQYAKLLSGRYIQDFVYPLQLKEILFDQQIESRLPALQHKAKLANCLESFLRDGAFPEVYQTTLAEHKREILLSYYETILLKDCLANYPIRDHKTFQELAYYLITHVGCLYSYNQLAESVESNENTVKQFLSVLESGFLFDEIKPFSYSLKKQNKGKKKCYCVDSGLIQAISFKFSENKGRLFENAVYTELKKAGFQEIYFYHDMVECDFIARLPTRETVAVQACYELTEENRAREFKGLKAAMQALKLDRGLILTFNQSEISPTKNIQILPLWEWALH